MCVKGPPPGWKEPTDPDWELKLLREVMQKSKGKVPVRIVREDPKPRPEKYF